MTVRQPTERHGGTAGNDEEDPMTIIDLDEAEREQLAEWFVDRLLAQAAGKRRLTTRTSGARLPSYESRIAPPTR
jgi:hypothetical protein